MGDCYGKVQHPWFWFSVENN